MIYTVKDMNLMINNPSPGSFYIFSCGQSSWLYALQCSKGLYSIVNLQRDLNQKQFRTSKNELPNMNFELTYKPQSKIGLRISAA